MMKTRVSSRGQVVLPVELRRRDDIRAGDQFEVQRVDRGAYILRRKAARRKEGLVALLLSCPARGWFQPLDRNESTDDIPGPGGQ